MITRWLAGLSAALLLAGGVAGRLAAQQVPDEPVDRIVAIVGTTALTFTQLQEEFYSRWQMTGQPPPEDPEVLRTAMRPILDTLINDELFYQQALRDTTIQVTPIEISDAVDQTLRSARRQFPSEQAFQGELRKAGFLGIDDYRRWLIERQGRELLKNRYVQKLRDDGKLAPLAPTEREVRAFYESHREQLAVRGPTVSFKQIVIRPKADSVAKARAYALADSIAKELRAGADFAVAAKRFSDDPGSRDKGGDLGWVRPGVMVREFERVAFGLPLGTISNPVESPYGYHVIQAERSAPTERKIRHILIAPAIDSTGVAGAEATADRLHDLLLAGASFDSLQGIYHDGSEEREGRGILVDSLPSFYQAALAGVDSGQVSPVFTLSVPGSPVPPKFGVAKVLQRTASGARPYDESREDIRRYLGQKMAEDRYLAELRRKTYVDVRDL